MTEQSEITNATEPVRSATPSALELTFIQLFPDDHYRGLSKDGTGYDLMPAEHTRAWMDKSPRRFAYRCLPLTVANQLGYWLTNPVGFTVDWDGSPNPGNAKFTFDSKPERWSRFINDQFGGGIITWNNPFFIRTKPGGSRILVMPPANRFKPDAQCLTAWVETDWLVATFTLNWRISRPGTRVRFEAGEPIAQLLPLAHNSLEALEGSKVRVCSAADEPALMDEYRAWVKSRSNFLEHQKRDEAWDEWQRDYFRGRDVKSPGAATMGHNIKVRHPAIDGAKRLNLGAATPETSPAEGDQSASLSRPVMSWRMSKDAGVVTEVDGFLELALRESVAITWKGGAEFDVSVPKQTALPTSCAGPPAPIEVVPDPANPGTLIYRTGLRVTWPAPYALSIMPARGADTSGFSVIAELVPHAAGEREISVRLKWLTSGAPVSIPTAPLVRFALTLRPDLRHDHSRR